jgi:SSS family solute:Na+ symporter
MILGIPVYGGLLWALPDVAFLHHMSITFGALLLFMVAVTLVAPRLDAPAIPQPDGDFDLTPSSGVRWAGAAIVVATAMLYAIFW